MYKTDFVDTPWFWVMIIMNSILLIVFLRMAWNIAQLRKGLVKTTSTSIQKEIEKLNFMGREGATLELYFQLLWDKFHDKDEFPDDKARQMNDLAKKIDELGGCVPNEVKEYIKEHPKNINN